MQILVYKVLRIFFYLFWKFCPKTAINLGVLIRINNTIRMLLKIQVLEMEYWQVLRQKIQESYPEEQFSEEKLAKMERDVINLFTLLVTEYNKQKHKKSLQNGTDAP